MMISYTERTPIRNPKIHLPEPDIDADLAARLIAVRFGLALHVATLVADLAGLGARQ